MLRLSVLGLPHEASVNCHLSSAAVLVVCRND